MTTLLVSEVFPPRAGGSGRWFWELYRRLPHEEYLIAAGEDPQHTAFDRTHNVPLMRLPLANPWRTLTHPGSLRCYWHTARRLLKVMRRHQVKTIHCGRCLPEGLVALLLKLWTGVRYVCYTHGEEINIAGPDEAAPLDGMMSSRQLRWLTGWVLRSADGIIANSCNTENILTQGWRLPRERVHLLHPGVDTRRFVPAPRGGAVREALGWGNRPVVLTVSRLQKRKGHDRMIRALHAVRERVPDVLYAIVGDGEERAALEALVRQEGLDAHVRLHGELDDAAMVQCYQQCDLFVLPNRRLGRDIEGFGIVLLEAQACGKPVIAGNSGGTAETMRIPDTGRVVCCEQPDELARTVGELLADPELIHRMGQAARQWVVEHFDWDELSQKAARLFHAHRIVKVQSSALSPEVAA